MKYMLRVLFRTCWQAASLMVQSKNLQVPVCLQPCRGILIDRDELGESSKQGSKSKVRSPRASPVKTTEEKEWQHAKVILSVT